MQGLTDPVQKPTSARTKTGETLGFCGHSTDYSSYSTIDHVRSDDMKKVYCRCGCIIDLDSNYLFRRLKLGKDLECVNCRNARISREIDELNRIYSPDAEDEDCE